MINSGLLLFPFPIMISGKALALQNAFFPEGKQIIGTRHPFEGLDFLALGRKVQTHVNVEPHLYHHVRLHCRQEIRVENVKGEVFDYLPHVFVVLRPLRVFVAGCEFAGLYRGPVVDLIFHELQTNRHLDNRFGWVSDEAGGGVCAAL